MCLLYYIFLLFPIPSGLTICLSNQKLKAMPAGEFTGNWEQQTRLTSLHNPANNLQLKIRPLLCHFHLRGILNGYIFPSSSYPSECRVSTLLPPLFFPLLSSLGGSTPNPSNFYLFLSQRSLAISVSLRSGGPHLGNQTHLLR